MNKIELTIDWKPLEFTENKLGWKVLKIPIKRGMLLKRVDNGEETIKLIGDLNELLGECDCCSDLITHYTHYSMSLIPLIPLDIKITYPDF